MKYKKTNAALIKAVNQRQAKMAKVLDKQGVPYSTSNGEITAIRAKPLSCHSRIDEIAIDASRVAVECSVSFDKIFTENYPVPVEKIKRAFLNGGFEDDNPHIVLDIGCIKMRFESLDAKECLEQMRDFLESLEDWHERAVDTVLEANPVFGMNRLY